MPGKPYGTVLRGSEEKIRRSYDKLADIPVDQEMGSASFANATLRSSSLRSTRASEPKEVGGEEDQDMETTLKKSVSVTGPGTFLGRAQRTLTFEPTTEKGWWLDRQDLPDSMLIRVSVNNVWTTVRNIVLSSGSPHNYMRMTEHIVALKVGMGLDNVIVRMDSGDPPLFDRSSMDLVEAIEEAGIVSRQHPAVYVTVRDPVTVGGSNGSFLTFLPAENNSRKLTVDCAVHFRSAIGRQRIRFTVNRRTFRHGALARSNTTLWMMIYCKTIGKIFADMRNLGYTTKNILVAGPRRYFNKPNLVHEGKSLEAAWHRAALDLLAAVALIDRGRFAGRIISYKAGHTLDVQMIRALYRHDLLKEI